MMKRFFLAFSLFFSSSLSATTQANYSYEYNNSTTRFQPILIKETNRSAASLSTTWTIQANYSYEYYNSRTRFQPLLIKKTNRSAAFGCGFFCAETHCTSFLFSIFILHYDYYAYEISSAVVVWSANRDNLVGHGAKLNFTAAGDLVLMDVDGSIIWSTNTTGKSISRMNLTHTGNLVLFDVHNSVVWQSFDQPTDCLLPGQKLAIGQKLIPSVSKTNWTTQQGLFSLQVANRGLRAYVGSNPPQLYYTLIADAPIASEGTMIPFYMHRVFHSNSIEFIFTQALASSSAYVKLMPDGQLKLFEWIEGRSTLSDGKWTTGSNLFEIGKCGYPLACGRNALCTSDQQCICPTSNNSITQYFRAVNQEQPTQGCFEITPLTCNATEFQDFITLKDVAYFTSYANMKNVNVEACKQACLDDCSCKAAFFRNNPNSSNGYCYLPSEIFTMSNNDYPYYLGITAFIKVQNLSSRISSKGNNRVATIEASTIGSFVFLLVIVVAFIAYKQRKNSEDDEEYLDQVPGMPTRFSYHTLKACTEDFSKKLGEGGFGAVFQGTLEDGSKIAVKHLEGLVQVKKSFLAEVESIGSIHHVNLVRLVGFCAWKSQRLLVYEFMSNGSLDQWIYHGDRRHILTWECRKKIVFDIAKGLAYLHEECRQKIIHLDIKPQNILLDDDFNAKVSDFGLSKLIDRDQSHVMTTMRGTPGYMAPEWLSSIITEKVDVFSFGIVLLEILCGRKNFDRSQPEESCHLLRVFHKCWEQEKLLDLVDPYSEDMQTHGTEVVEMMKVASWCLQTDFTRRPSMSAVIKVLEGGMPIEENLDYNFSDPRLHKTIVEHNTNSTPLFPSVLSQPR